MMVRQNAGGSPDHHGSPEEDARDNREFEDYEHGLRPEDSETYDGNSAEDALSTSGYSSTNSGTGTRSLLERCRRKAWILPLIHTQFWEPGLGSVTSQMCPTG